MMLAKIPTARRAKGNGEAIRWLRAQVGWASDSCLSWPFSKNNGYGQLGLNGRMHYAHRLMCEIAHGSAPSDEYEAAHSCGRGNQGCVNPRHLSWKTRGENQLDRALHGTKNDGPRGRLSPLQAAEILALKGKMRQQDIAAKYGVTRSNVSFIHCGKAWAKKPRGVTYQPVVRLWRARVYEARRAKTIGFFDTEHEATAAYWQEVGRPMHAHD
jgi:hypothetical protein